MAPLAGAQDFSAVALSMKDLVRNGTFQGLEGWTTDGEGISVYNADGIKIKLRSPKSSVNGTRSITQNVAGIAGGHTLYLRFKAAGTVRIGVQLRETLNEAQKLIATSIARPGDDITGDLKQYAYAVRVPHGYGPEQLQVSFSFGNDAGEARISNVELFDQDFTNPATLPQTGMAPTRVPVSAPKPVANPLPTLGKAPAPAPAPAPVAADPAPVQNNVNFLRQPTTSTPAPSVPLISNGDFANGDQNWQAWGENVAANMDGNWLKLQLANPAGSKAADAGLNQPINAAVKAGDTISVRMKVKGNVHLMVHLEETKAPFRNVVTRTFQAKPEGEEILLVGRAESDWAAGDLRFEIQMGQDKGELAISNIQVSKQSPAF
jgi:hypothetical protein